MLWVLATAGFHAVLVVSVPARGVGSWKSSVPAIIWGCHLRRLDVLVVLRCDGERHFSSRRLLRALGVREGRGRFGVP